MKYDQVHCFNTIGPQPKYITGPEYHTKVLSLDSLPYQYDSPERTQSAQFSDRIPPRTHTRYPISCHANGSIVTSLQELEACLPVHFDQAETVQDYKTERVKDWPSGFYESCSSELTTTTSLKGG